MPLGLPRNNLASPAPVQRQQQPPTQIKEYSLPAPPETQPWERPQVQIQTTEPVTTQPQDVQAQSPPQQWQVQQHHQEPVQAHPLDHSRHVPDYTYEEDGQIIPETNINLEGSVNTSPYHQEGNGNIPQQLPSPDHSPSLRRSERATKGQTSRYDDFVQTICPVCPPSQAPSGYHQHQYPQIMTNLMWPNQLMTNHMMANQWRTNQWMINNSPQSTIQWYQ